MTEPAFRAARLRDLETGPGSDGSIWHKVRISLGVEAFGVNAFSADAGKRVIEEHTEAGTSAGKHQELYVVLSGRATFTVGGEEVDAPHGTLVFVRDPEMRRGAVAQEDGTTVLVVGGRPGEAFTTSPWEDASAAWNAYEEKDYDRAKEAFLQVLEKHPRAAGILYNLACVEALSGQTDAAIEHLEASIAIEQRFRGFAEKDEDFAAIRDDPRFPGGSPAA